jgi:hypothetical protein
MGISREGLVLGKFYTFSIAAGIWQKAVGDREPETRKIVILSYEILCYDPAEPVAFVEESRTITSDL